MVHAGALGNCLQGLLIHEVDFLEVKTVIRDETQKELLSKKKKKMNSNKPHLSTDLGKFSIIEIGFKHLG